MKQLIQSLLRPLGYQLQDIRKIGREPWRDLEILLQPNRKSLPVCFDVGAHHGETVIEIIRHFPDAIIYSFEPDPDNFKVLQAATKNIPSAKLFQMAMGDRHHQSKLLKTQYSQTNSLLPASASLKSEAHKKIGEVEINVTTIDQFCQEQKIETIDLLKTDCQGFDLRVLKGASKILSERRVNAIICESLFVSEYEGQGWFYEILQFLTEMNYAPVSFCDPTRNENNEAMWGDIIFKRKELANP